MSQDLNDKLKQNHRYTVAVVYDTHWTPKAGQFADAEFTAEGKHYTLIADADALEGQPLIGRRFLVEYHPPDPQRYSSLFLNAPVPGDVTEVPANGWETPPFPVPAEVLKPR